MALLKYCVMRSNVEFLVLGKGVIFRNPGVLRIWILVQLVLVVDRIKEIGERLSHYFLKYRIIFIFYYRCQFSTLQIKSSVTLCSKFSIQQTNSILYLIKYINNLQWVIILSMFKQQNYEEIFSHRIPNKSIEIIKKFFVFQPTPQATDKPYSSLASKTSQPPAAPTPKKQNPKFPGGFQQCYKSVQNVEEEQDGTPTIVLKSKRAPTNEISSFLLGLTGRINRESQVRLAEQKEEKNYADTLSPQRRINYEQVMANLNRMRRENRTKYTSIAPTSSTANSNSISVSTPTPPINSTSTQLPLLEKRLTSPDRKSAGSNSVTPTLSNKSSTPSYSTTSEQGQAKEKKWDKYGNLNSNRIISVSYSSKLMMPVEEPSFVKGYLFYDPSAKELLDKYQNNTLGEAKIKKNLQSITARNYLIIDRQSLCIIAQRNPEQQIQIASLTKIMTCYLCIMVCRKYRVDLKEVQVRVSEKAEQMPGTSAELQAGDIVTLKDLLYALMLPSGNDASIAIAETVGKIIQKNKKKVSKKSYFETFIVHMNLLAKQMNIEQNYQNTSGLSLNPNFSSPKAVTILTAIALKSPLFYEIINCKEYEVQIRNERYGLMRKQIWKNTNKLLWKGWQGVKTGTTDTAGHCLMSCKGNYIISVFNCETLNKRFTQCCRIYQQICNMPDFQMSRVVEVGQEK